MSLFVPRLRFGLVVLLAVSWLPAAVGGAPPLELRLSDEVKLTVRADRAELLDKVKGTEFLALEPQSPPTERTVEGGARVWEQEFLLTPLQPGKHSLTLPSLRYRIDDGEWRTPPLTVHVQTRIKVAEPSAARDITAIEELPRVETGGSWLLWVALGLGGVATGVLAIILGRRGTTRRPPLPPDQWALQELERLAAESPATALEIERYHTALSSVVRRYLEKRFQIPAQRQTTAEFLAAVSASSALTPAHQTLLGELLARCDLAKFARVRPSLAVCQALVSRAQEFVRETAPKPT
ncbi:MAG TPA: hypothetical protein VEL76_14745 [Gemmataceae bacterium]|nr:hypothetical protein [Gemmataceae bacterium]